MINDLINAFRYPFVVYALIAGVLIALCSSLFGVTLVVKRYSFIGDGLSHVAFGALSVATVLNIVNDMIVVLPVTVICAVLLLRRGSHSQIKGDAAIAMLSAGALAFGYLLTNRFAGPSNIAGDVCTTLFGSMSILTLDFTDVVVCSVLAVAVIAVFVIFYNRIFAVTFDEDFARAVGVRAGIYNLMTAVIIAVIIVLAMNLVGSLLISALIVFPALAAMRVCQSFRAVIVCSAVFSVVAVIVGITASILAATPVGSSIVIADVAGFLVFALIEKIKKRI